jgi:hypothetical protein
MLRDSEGRIIEVISYDPTTQLVQVHLPGVGEIFSLKLSEITHAQGVVAHARAIKAVSVRAS